jgi:hypothetical protein
MKELLSVIAVWLSVSFGLPDVEDHPRIRTLPPQILSEIRYGPIELVPYPLRSPARYPGPKTAKSPVAKTGPNLF